MTGKEIEFRVGSSHRFELSFAGFVVALSVIGAACVFGCFLGARRLLRYRDTEQSRRQKEERIRKNTRRLTEEAEEPGGRSSPSTRRA